MFRRRGRSLVVMSIGILFLCVLAFGISRMVASEDACGARKSCDRRKAADSEQESRVVYPVNNSVLLPGSFNVICACSADADPRLVVNGEVKPWDPINGTARAARISLSPGKHKLVVGGHEIECVVALNELEHDGPDDWPIQRSHYISSKPDRCGRCHDIEGKESAYTVGEFKGPETCIECHEESEFEITHMHVYQPLEACHTCHTMHGSTQEKSLLKAPVRTLCEGCHDPDH